MNQQNTCSVIIIAKNEEKRIATCIEHVRFASEIIVVDNGSIDETARIATLLHAKVIKISGKDFSALRETGAKNATGDWLLYIDADELVTPELQKEIIEMMTSGSAAAYFITRENYYLGHRWPTKDKMIRLIKKSALLSWQGSLHEHAEIDGVVETLSASLVHQTHRTLSEMVEKTNEWSEIEANLRLSSGHPIVVWWRFIRVMLTAFNDSFWHQQGWRAGTVGWIESIYQAFSMFITYAKLWEKQQNKS
ncbi:MAG: glycosyltransferase family 2 protein [Microgenomates group bacterium]